VLCKHEVVGSIPSGSTSLRSRGEQGCHAGADRRRRAVVASFGWASQPIAKQTPIPSILVRENINSQALLSPERALCVISDIVKRRSIRVGSREQSRVLHYLQIISALAPSQDEAGCK
jgi:hypothetical protein